MPLAGTHSVAPCAPFCVLYTKNNELSIFVLLQQSRVISLRRDSYNKSVHTALIAKSRQVVRATRLNPHCRQGPVDCRKEDSPIWDDHSMAGDAVDRLQERRQPWVVGEEHRRRVAVGAAAA
jgi:hypothetical protein